MACVNDIYFTRNEIIDEFLKEYGKLNSSKDGKVSYSVNEPAFISALALYQELEKDPAYALEFEKKRLRFKGITDDSLQCRIYIAWKRGKTETTELLEYFFRVIDTYVDVTRDLMVDKGYKYTVEQVAKMLNVGIDYVQTDLLPQLSYFKINNLTRYAIKHYFKQESIKIEGLTDIGERLYWRKEVFIQEESLIKLIMGRLKYTEVRQRVVLSLAEYPELLETYETKNNVKAVLKVYTEEMEGKRADGLGKIGAPAPAGKLKIDKGPKDISEADALSIIYGSLVLDSPNTIKAFLKDYRESLVDENKDYRIITIARTQVYKFLDATTHKRFVWSEGVDEEDNQLLNEKIVRYYINTDDKIVIGEGKDNIAFTLNKEHLGKIEKLRGDESVQDYIVGELMRKKHK